MGHPNTAQGTNVRLSFASANASAASIAVVLYDPDGNVRTLLPYERLVIDSLVAELAAGVTADVLNVPAGAATTTQATQIAVFGPLNNDYAGTKEDLDIPKGVTPSVLSSGAGEVKIVGNARIINASTQTGRQNWQSNLNP